MNLKTGYIQIGMVTYKEHLRAHLEQLEAAAEAHETKEKERLEKLALNLPAIKEVFRQIFDFAMEDYRKRNKPLFKDKVNPPTIDSNGLRVNVDRCQYDEFRRTFTAMISGVDHEVNRFSDFVVFTYRHPQIRVDRYRQSSIDEINLQLRSYPNSGLIELTLKEAEKLDIEVDDSTVIYR